MTEVLKEVKELIIDSKEKIKAIQDKTDDLEKGYDGLRNEEIKELKEQLQEQLKEAQDIRLKNEEIEKQVEEIIKKASRPGAAGEEKSEAQEEYKSALMEFYRKGDKSREVSENLIKSSEAFIKEYVDVKFPNESKRNKEDIVKTLSTDSGPDGGYLVLPERLNQMVTRTFETSPMRSLANVISTTSNGVEMVIDDNESTSGGWVSEQEARIGTDTPQIGLLEIFVHEQYAEPKITMKMIQDSSINIEAWLAQKTNDIITRTENTAFVTGNGVAKPKGILAYDAWDTFDTYQRGKVEQINSGSATTFTIDGIKKLKNQVKEPYQGNSNFLTKRASWEDIIVLKDGNGKYLVNPESPSEGDKMFLLGKPVIFADDMPSVAGNALAMAYGDFRTGYTIVDRLGMQVLRDPYTDKRYIKFYTTKRVGGGVTNYESFKILKIAA